MGASKAKARELGKNLTGIMYCIPALLPPQVYTDEETPQIKIKFIVIEPFWV